MYAYYMLSAIGGKNLWWKKYLTVMQIVSIFLLIALNDISYVIFYKNKTLK